jgi:sugar/nucleoside kinase (ribokinase family)
VGNLDGVHNQHTARPMDVVRQEIAGMAVVIRNEVEAERDGGKGEEEEAEEEMRRRLKSRARDEYVRRMGQSEAVVMPLVEEFCAGF